MPNFHFKVKYPKSFWCSQDHCIPLVPVIPQFGGINTDNTCRSLDTYNTWNYTICDQVSESIQMVRGYLELVPESLRDGSALQSQHQHLTDWVACLKRYLD